MTLKDEQEVIINLVKENKSIYALLPTGFGKSFLSRYLAEKKIKERIILISPLKAILDDQFRKAESQNINCDKLVGGNDNITNSAIIELFNNGFTNILYTTPESFLIHHNILDPDLVIFDEVDSVIEYQNYRPSMKLAFEKVKKFQFLLMSATQDLEFSKEILDIENIVYVNNTQERSNINLVNEFYDNPNFKNLLKHLDRNSPTLIFARTINQVNIITENLRKRGMLAMAYHSKLKKAEKENIQKDFINDDIQIVVSTTALSRGFDKENVKKVIHYSTPQSELEFIQKSGRAGRNGDKAFVVTFINKLDIHTYSKIAKKPILQVVEEVNKIINTVHI